MGFWHNPTPSAFVGGAQPLAPHVGDASREAVTVNNPPFDSASRLARIDPIIAAWQPPPPNAYVGGFQPLSPRPINPQITAVRVDNPPFLGDWVFQQTALIASQPASPQPILQIKGVPVGIPVNEPPYSMRHLDAVLAQWFPQVVMPTLPKNLNPSALSVRIDNPPFGSVMRTSEVLVTQIADGWIAPDPTIFYLPKRVQQGITPLPSPFVDRWLDGVVSRWWGDSSYLLPELPGKLLPTITNVRVDQPPLISHSTLFEVLGLWQPPPFDASAQIRMPPKIVFCSHYTWTLLGHQGQPQWRLVKNVRCQ